VNNVGKGKAVYIGADLHPPDLFRVLGAFAGAAGIQRAIDVPAGVELTVRNSGSRRWLCVLNHKSEAQMIHLAGTFKDANSGQAHRDATELPAYGVLVLEKV
ncbi:MAG: hypothetical protein DMG97_40155, partial [Acidobacteria bacterium]